MRGQEDQWPKEDRNNEKEESADRKEPEQEVSRTIDYRDMIVQMRGVGVSLKQLCDIPPGELAMMILLSRQDPSGQGIRPSEIGRQMRLSRPAVSRMLRSLKKKEYLKVISNPEDLRYMKAVLTKKGKDSLTAELAKCTGILGRVVDRMGISEIKRMLSYNQKFMTYLSEELQ